ncbi:hypothetical protein IHE49_12235 [Rhodanobacter sp. 7MK24]|uniref:hypothetical protein n=1 Tax=Rhodanobacter sp. 7MK24 TaxID=2775922 RepID=UPI001787658D|nr:hypothetical protein [Rhodanobacter sp. 7MK24]MBD8881250.1 hypothetical protein [Rhodanobacter sp. 7MK24]
MKTSLYTVLCIAIRLGAVLMAVGLLESVPLFLWNLNSSDGRFAKLALVLTASGLAIAFVLWLKPGVLAWWASSGRSKGEVFESHIEANQIQHIALSVLGVWLAISGFASMTSLAIQLVRLHLQIEGYSGAQIPGAVLGNLSRALVTTVAGVALALGSRGLVGLLYRLRGYPTQPAVAGGDDEITPRD